MAKYSASHQTAAGTTLTIIMLLGSAAIRCKVADLLIGSDATPADVATEFNFRNASVSGTEGGTALTESPLDPLTVAATGAAKGGTFTEAQITKGNILLMIALNQRATFRWVAAPGYELIAAAAANNGLTLESIGSGGTPNINTTVMWEE